MSVSQIAQLLISETPERRNAEIDAVRREVEAVLLAGSALPDGTAGSLRLRAHRLIRGGWKFVRCLDPACGRNLPNGTAILQLRTIHCPLFLCRSCGADYLRLSGDPASGQMSLS